MGCVCGKESVLIDGVNYDLGRVVGEGGFSTVTLATSRAAKTPKAIKTLTAHSQRDLNRAKQEIQLHQQLAGHENVLTLERSAIVSSQAVAYRGQGRHQLTETSTIYMVFPYYRRRLVERGTLQDDLTRQYSDPGLERRSERDILALFLDVARGLEQFHQLQPPFAHRDVKPANVLLADDGKGVLMDFGSAGPARPDVRTSSQALALQVPPFLALQEEAAEHCSMPYRPPELFTVIPGARIDERTDIWSLGCLLYALSFLRSPFEAVQERGDSVALAVAGACIWIPDHSALSEDLHALILDMMSLHLEDRPFIAAVIARAQALFHNAPDRGAKVV